MNDEMEIEKKYTIAVLLTVFNRRDITINSLRLLKKSISNLQEGYQVDIYMTDDGCKDGTSDAVAKEFPEVHILKGDGSLFWSGGMRMAWQAAIDSGMDYDYYLWFNDDAMIYEDALQMLIIEMQSIGGIGIISGAFKDSQEKPSYGAWDKSMNVITPNGELQPVYLLNGNLVLISKRVVEKIGIIDKVFKHSLGDWDYGRRACKAGFKVLLSEFYVGQTDRHDTNDLRMYNSQYSFKERWKYMHSPKYAPQSAFIYNQRHDGFLMALVRFIVPYIYMTFPLVYKLNHRRPVILE